MKKLVQLIQANAGRSRALRAEAQGDTAKLYIYDAIDPWFGVTAKDVVRALDGIKASTIHLHINSPGGDVFEARAIKTALEAHGAKIVSHIDGLAASAASVIMLAGREINIAKGAFVMVHNPWAFTYGEADEMRKTADLLDKVAGTIAADYQARTGAQSKQVKDWMDAETWFTAEEAVDAGFCDAVIETDAVTNAHDLTVYDRLPEALKPKAKAPDPDISEAERQISAFRETAERRLSFYEATQGQAA